jgi:hypothetical protein
VPGSRPSERVGPTWNAARRPPYRAGAFCCCAPLARVVRPVGHVTQSPSPSPCLSTLPAPAPPKPDRPPSAGRHHGPAGSGVRARARGNRCGGGSGRRSPRRAVGSLSRRFGWTRGGQCSGGTLRWSFARRLGGGSLFPLQAWMINLGRRERRMNVVGQTGPAAPYAVSTRIRNEA